MSNAKPESQNDGGDSANADEERSVQDSATESLRADADDHPIKLLLNLATDDNVENEGVELKVENVREAAGTALLTRTELQKYDDYKKQWAATLERPQESLEALAQREQQIIEAAANHDWETLDRLRGEVAADLERMQFIFSNIISDMSDL